MACKCSGDPSRKNSHFQRLNSFDAHKSQHVFAESPEMLAVVPETVTVVPVPGVKPVGPYCTSNVDPVDV